MVLEILLDIVIQELDGVGQKDEEDDEPVSFGTYTNDVTLTGKREKKYDNIL